MQIYIYQYLTSYECKYISTLSPMNASISVPHVLCPYINSSSYSLRPMFLPLPGASQRPTSRSAPRTPSLETVQGNTVPVSTRSPISSVLSCTHPVSARVQTSCTSRTASPGISCYGPTHASVSTYEVLTRQLMRQ